jgi:hypothetical protein
MPIHILVDRAYEFRPLRENGLGKSLRLANGIKSHGRCGGVLEQIVKGYIKAEICGLLRLLFNSHPILLKFACPGDTAKASEGPARPKLPIQKQVAFKVSNANKEIQNH